MAFPTLSRRPKSEAVEPIENLEQHGTQSGFVYRRPKYTRNRLSWVVVYDLLSASDFALLHAHWQSVRQHLSFIWYDKKNVARVVYYDEPLTWVEEVTGWYRISAIKLVEY